MARTLERQFIQERAYSILKNAYGSGAQFHPGQLDAIVSVVSGRDSLVVEKTGWGKSLVYFVSTKILRENGAGPTLIISPLLALMENQVESARIFGVDAVAVNSDNKDQWDDIYRNLNRVDALIVSPERLSNEQFMRHLAEVPGIELVVVDEAHSISDWGHDFRPDYQRVSKIIDGLPGNVTVLGTTATANDRVISDIKEQMGGNLEIVRGDLIRENLAIQVNPLQTREQRLAWLAQMLVGDEILSNGQGIIYCLTHSDCTAVADFLSERGVSILPYYSGMGEDERGMSIEKQNLASFVAGDTRVLAATVKLGMGYDKSDIRFVIHFQLPQNLIAYYQQIGRAGRDGKPAYAFLLHGEEDEEILTHFIATAQASPNLLEDIVGMARSGVRYGEMLKALNVKGGKLDEALKYLLVHDYLYRDGSVYRASFGKAFDAAAEREKRDQITKTRIAEHEALIGYLDSTDCFMKHVAAELDAPDAQETCGICANCRGGFIVPVSADQSTVAAATRYLGGRHGEIAPRKVWGSRARIKPELQMRPGWVLCADYYSAAGQKVKEGKYTIGSFSGELVDASSRYLKEKVAREGIDCVVPIPSRRHPRLVPDFAKSLAASLGIPCVEAVQKTCGAAEQKMLLNSAQQEDNIRNSTAVTDSWSVRGKSILLVDDMVDSRWTFTVVAAELLEAGASSVYPFALVKTGSGD